MVIPAIVVYNGTQKRSATLQWEISGMGSLPYRVYRLTGGIVDVVVISRKRPDGAWSTSVLQQLPGWGFRLAELAPVPSEDCIPRVLEGFKKWAGGQIQEVELMTPYGAKRRQDPCLDSGWVRLKNRHFFRILEVG